MVKAEGISTGGSVMSHSYRRLIAAGLAAGLLGGCTSYYSMRPLENGEQQVRYERGVATTYSIGGRAALRITPVRTEFRERPVFRLAISNVGERSFNIGAEHITIASPDDDVHVYTYHQIARERRNAAAWSQFFNAMQLGVDTYNAHEASHSTTNYQSTTSGSRSFVANNGVSGYRVESRSTTGRSVTYDPGMQAILTAQARMGYEAREASIERALDDQISDLRMTYLQTTTVDPGETFGGLFVIDKPELGERHGETIAVSVDIRGERHTFHFRPMRH